MIKSNLKYNFNPVFAATGNDKLSGMSNGEDLVEVWNKFKSPDEPSLEVKWNFENPKYAVNDDVKPTIYIMNLRSLYNNKVPGHWIAMIRVKSHNKDYDKIYYYDPFGTILPKIGSNVLKARYIYENLVKEQNFKGVDSDSCGYFCILFLLSWIRRTKYYNYAVFDNKYKKFIDTIPNNKYIKINLDAMEKELVNNEMSAKI